MVARASRDRCQDVLSRSKGGLPAPTCHHLGMALTAASCPQGDSVSVASMVMTRLHPPAPCGHPIQPPAGRQSMPYMPPWTMLPRGAKSSSQHVCRRGNGGVCE